MKKEIPLVLGLIAGFLWFAEFFIAGVFFENMRIFFADGFKVGGAVGVLVGMYSVYLMNYNKIKYNNDRWYAILQLSMIVLMIFLGVLRGDAPGTPYNAMFMYVYTPFVATMFSILAFYVASAAFRSFRAKSLESALMLIAATIVMLGKIPVGEYLSDYIPMVGEWILDGPGSAGRRAIIIGGSLGGITMMIRIFFGLERSHLSE
jgi:hypothetical protein